MRQHFALNNYPFVLVFISLILFLLLSPVLSTFFVSILFTFILLAGIYASFEGKFRLNFGLVAGALTILVIWGLEMESQNVYLNIFRFVFLFVFVSFVCHVMLKKVISSKEIDFNIISGAISVYILIALLFSFVFATLYFFDKSSFHLPDDQPMNFIYFSYVTITTLGYGDINPASPMARSLAVVLALIGQLYLTILVAILVSKFKGWKQLQEDDD